MDKTTFFFFVIYPYIVLTTFVVGHIYRYVTDRYHWNARSSELLEKRGAYYRITLFHWGILLTLLGHTGGLLIPQRYYDLIGINGQVHTSVAIGGGFIFGLAAFLGVGLLLHRRITKPRIAAITTWNDFVTLILLFLATGAGLYNVIFGHFYVLDTIAPWIRGIVLLRPDPQLMLHVPLSYKVHIIIALGLLGFSPFSRLIHIWSAPFTYLIRKFLLFRVHEESVLQGGTSCHTETHPSHP
jgi:nitrate reductase gamma subunit